ncbi:MAG: hypothetical protein Q8P68_05970 [Candidatus Peregrinibacteria bacterium]|nr:hypothetical protein [Candidatus Peregrinibacteria bacterium]MDZ4244944.1 hypothetical protein [Candidatus Gracilibacteria bacterium]
MKGKFLISLISLILILGGCTQQAQTTKDQKLEQASADVNKSVDSIIKWESYNGSNFNVNYPAYLSQTIESEGVRTTVYFQSEITTQNYEELLSIASMPNQGGLTLDEWTDEVLSQSSWIKQGSIQISGQTAYNLILPETDAGSRYVFLSKDSRTIFDMTVQHFDGETTDLIISSFELIEFVQGDAKLSPASTVTERSDFSIFQREGEK